MKNKLKCEVLELYHELDRTPTITEFNEKYKSAGKVHYYFKTWNELLECAGIPTVRGVSKQDTINRMLSLYKELSRTPLLEEFIEKYGAGGIYSNFKGYNELILSSGLKVNQGYTKNDLRDILIKQALKLGRIPKLSEFAEDEKPKPDIYHYFDNWYDFLNYCNVEKDLKNTFINKGNHYKVTVYNSERNKKEYILIDIDKKDMLENRYINWNLEVGASISDHPNSPVRLAIFLYGATNEDEVYIFLNKDNRDYRSKNIRLVSVQEKVRNNKLRLDNKTGVKGVSWNNQRKKYQVSIGLNGKTKYIGMFDTLQEATNARLQAEEKYWGKAYQKDLEA